MIRDCFVSRIRESFCQSLLVENHIPSYTLLCLLTLASIFLKQYEAVYIHVLSRGVLGEFLAEFTKPRVLV